MVRKRFRRIKRIARYVMYRETLIDPIDHFWTFLGSFSAIGLIGFLQNSTLASGDVFFLIGSFGASSVLVFGSVNSPLAQPRNLVGGHLLSAIIGVSMYKMFPDYAWLYSSLAVSFSIVVMQITKTMHPPGGATALIATIGSEKVKALGFAFVFYPVMTGVLILLGVSWAINTIAHRRG